MTDQPEVGDVYTLHKLHTTEYIVKGVRVETLTGKVFPIMKSNASHPYTFSNISHDLMLSLGYKLKKKNCEHSQFWKS